MSDTSGSEAQSSEAATDSETQQGTEDKPLGPAGEKALEEWKNRAKASESSLKEAQKAAQERDALQSRLNEYEEASKTEHEKALDKARKESLAQGKSESDAAWSKRVVKAEVKAAAREKFADPSDALAFIDLGQFKVDDEGNADDKAITAALDALLKDKPHLGKQEQKSTTGSADQGARGTGTRSTDMNAVLRNAIAGKR